MPSGSKKEVRSAVPQDRMPKPGGISAWSQHQADADEKAQHTELCCPCSLIAAVQEKAGPWARCSLQTSFGHGLGCRSGQGPFAAMLSTCLPCLERGKSGSVWVLLVPRRLRLWLRHLHHALLICSHCCRRGKMRLLWPASDLAPGLDPSCSAVCPEPGLQTWSSLRYLKVKRLHL